MIIVAFHSAVKSALETRSPFAVASVVKIGAAGSRTLVSCCIGTHFLRTLEPLQVRRFEEQLEILVLVKGLNLNGSDEYRAPFIDFLLEYLKHNLSSTVHPPSHQIITLCTMPMISVCSQGFVPDNFNARQHVIMFECSGVSVELQIMPEEAAIQPSSYT